MRLPVFLHHLEGRFSRGIFWNVVGAFFSQGSVFFTAIFLARILGIESFGEFGMIQSTLLTITSIAQVATGVTATKYVAEFRHADKERASRVLGLCSVMTFITGIVATGLLMIGASFLTEHVLRAPYLSESLLIAASFVLFSVMNAYQIGALAGLERYKSISFYSALLGIVHFAACVSGAQLWGLAGAFGGMAVSALLRWLVFGVALRREVRRQGLAIVRRDCLQEREIMFGFALPAALSGLTSMPAIWIGHALLVRQTDGYEEMGLYSAVNNIRLLMLVLPALINSVGVSVLNNNFGNRDSDGYLGVFYTNVKLTAFIAFFSAFIMVAFSAFIPGWYGMESDDNSKVLILILAIAIVPEVISVSVYQLIQVRKKMWMSFFLVALPRDLIMITLAYVLIPYWAGIGLGLAYISAWLLALIVIITIVFRLKLHDTSWG